MITTGIITDIGIDYKTRKSKISLLLDTREIDVIEQLQNTDKLNIELKKYRKRRSIDANSYCWVLCDKIAKELSKEPNKRELDMLVSTGEQISCAKFAILLNEMGYKATSLTGWQAGILTDSDYTQAKIQDIYPNTIWGLLETNDVIVIAGFQGIDANKNITTLGRDGSDTTAVAIAAALEQKECYIYTDIDGIYNIDLSAPKKLKKFHMIIWKN